MFFGTPCMLGVLRFAMILYKESPILQKANAIDLDLKHLHSAFQPQDCYPLNIFDGFDLAVCKLKKDTECSLLILSFQVKSHLNFPNFWNIQHQRMYFLLPPVFRVQATFPCLAEAVKVYMCP